MPPHAPLCGCGRTVWFSPANRRPPKTIAASATKPYLLEQRTALLCAAGCMESAKPQTGCQLIIHYGGNAEEASEDYLETTPHLPDVPQLFVNYRGYGDSEGKPSAAALRADALLLFDEITQKLNIAPAEVCPMGYSLGSHMAAYVAANRPVAAC